MMTLISAYFHIGFYISLAFFAFRWYKGDFKNPNFAIAPRYVKCYLLGILLALCILFWPLTFIMLCRNAGITFTKTKDGVGGEVK